MQNLKVEFPIIGADKIADNAVTSSKIADGAVTTIKLADESVEWTKLSPSARASNPNLLDNAYFIGGGSQQGGGQFPINQRGLTEYTGDNSYSLDRWKLGVGGKLTIQDKFIRVEKTTQNYNPPLSQIIEAPSRLAGKTVTLSALLRGSAQNGIWLAITYNSTYYRKSFNLSSDFSLYSITFTLPDTLTAMGCNILQIIEGDANAIVECIAAKLELGPYQTLAYESAGGGGS